jgi:predicted HicB family RNase H-like nuclease
MVLELAFAASCDCIVTQNVTNFRNCEQLGVKAITPRDFFETHPTKTMDALTVRLPEFLHTGIKALARREGYSINQFLATAATENMSALLTAD